MATSSKPQRELPLTKPGTTTSEIIRSRWAHLGGPMDEAEKRILYFWFSGVNFGRWFATGRFFKCWSTQQNLWISVSVYGHFLFILRGFAVDLYQICNSLALNWRDLFDIMVSLDALTVDNLFYFMIDAGAKKLVHLNLIACFVKFQH